MRKPNTWDELSSDQKMKYRMGDSIKMESWYIDGLNIDKTIYTEPDIENFIKRAKNKEVLHYGTTDTWLYEALELVPVEGKSVAVMGSVVPWYESIVLSYGGLPTTVEYNLPNYNHPSIREILLPDLLQSGQQFDAAISISSFEHDGLGRYGDPLDPNGDLRAMSEMKKLLKPDGILYLAVPCGLDKIVWNAHRIYGNQRLKLLINGWEVLGTVGYDSQNLFIDTGVGGVYQPIIVLKNI